MHLLITRTYQDLIDSLSWQFIIKYPKYTQNEELLSIIAKIYKSFRPPALALILTPFFYNFLCYNFSAKFSQSWLHLLRKVFRCSLARACACTCFIKFFAVVLLVLALRCVASPALTFYLAFCHILSRYHILSHRFLILDLWSSCMPGSWSHLLSSNLGVGFFRIVSWSRKKI
jgi:hypothetical protein